MPRRRTKILCAVVLLAALTAALLWFFGGGLEPRYQGQPISHWFDLYVKSGGKSEEAQTALRSLGSEAVPYLSHQLFGKPMLYDSRARARSLARWTYRTLPAGEPIDWNRRRFAIQALGEIGRAASNAIPQLITTITNSEPAAVDPSTGQRYGKVGHIGGLDRPAIDALAKIGPDSPVVLHAITNLLARRYEMSERSAAALLALSRLTPPKEEIPGIIEILRRREAFLWNSWQYSVNPTNVENYLAMIKRFTPEIRRRDSEEAQALAYGFGTATNLPPGDRQRLVSELVALHHETSGYLLQDSIVMIDPAAGQKIFVYVINQTEFQQFDLRLRALESLRRMGPLALIRLDGHDGLAVKYVTRCLSDEVPIVRLWARETLQAITATNQPAVRSEP